jgi:hypothetical protein
VNWCVLVQLQHLGSCQTLTKNSIYDYEWTCFVIHSSLWGLRKIQKIFWNFFYDLSIWKDFFSFKIFKNLFEFWLRSVVVALGTVLSMCIKTHQLRPLYLQLHPILPETEPQILLNVWKFKSQKYIFKFKYHKKNFIASFEFF